jgi:type III secretory pathway component EscR
MYIRVDNKRIEIKRRYQDLMEFYADTSALLLSIFWILGIIFAYYDRIKANHSISKKLFYFEGIKKNKFDQFRDFKKFIKANEEMQIDNLEHNVINPIQNSDSKTNETKDIFIRGTRNIEFEEKTGIQKDERIIIKQKTNKEMKKEKKNDDDNNDDLINYTNYNIFEMIGSFKICFCKTKKFENKVNLIKQSRNMIDDKLDIVLYIKNMILFEMINKIYLENKSIINFLSRPIIYLNEDNEDNLKNPDVNSSFESYDEYKRINDKKLGKNEYRTLLYLQGGDFYKSAYRFKPDNLSKNIEKLILKEGQTKIKQKIIYYLKKHLKGVKLNNKKI